MSDNFYNSNDGISGGADFSKYWGSEDFSYGASFPSSSITSADIHSLGFSNSSNNDVIISLTLPPEYPASTDITAEIRWGIGVTTGTVNWTI